MTGEGVWDGIGEGVRNDVGEGDVIFIPTEHNNDLDAIALYEMPSSCEQKRAFCFRATLGKWLVAGPPVGIGDVHEAGVEFGGSAATYIGEGAVELDFEDVEHVLDAIGSAIGESPIEGATD